MGSLQSQQRSYFDTRFESRMLAIAPGSHALTARPDEMLTTLLGSCVAACLYDPELGIGGMNHFLLPHGPRHGQGSDEASQAYGDHAMEVLINGLVKAGARRGRLAAKVFGGAALKSGVDHYSVGKRNIAFCLSFLANERIAVLSSDTGGDVSRRVVFHPATGKVHLNQLTGRQAGQLAQSEAHYAHRVTEMRKPSALELF
jgi:chemotaxis protein CheD